MKIPSLPSLSSMVWPVIVALSLAGLLYMTITLKADNIELTKKIDSLSKQITASQKVNTDNNTLTEKNNQADKQLMKDAGRSELLFKKPTLIERKINTSFDLYMQEFDK